MMLTHARGCFFTLEIIIIPRQVLKVRTVLEMRKLKTEVTEPVIKATLHL